MLQTCVTCVTEVCETGVCYVMGVCYAMMLLNTTAEAKKCLTDKHMYIVSQCFGVVLMHVCSVMMVSRTVAEAAKTTEEEQGIWYMRHTHMWLLQATKGC